MANTDYIDKNDPALKAVESEKATALNDSNKLYDDAVTANDKAIQGMIDQNNKAAKEAAKIQQEQTDFTIDKIEQQKAQAQKDYTKEQSASYVDYQKQSGQYGANAEAMADRGMSNTGYSESAQVSMFNTYQNRVAVAREAFGRVKLEYDNGIREAKLQNSSALAKIKVEAMAKQLELALQGLQYKNTMLTEKAAAARAVDQMYQSKYMDVYDKLYKEAALKEQARQFDETMKLQEGLTIDRNGSPGGTIDIAPSRNSGSGSNGDGPILKPELVTDVHAKDATTSKVISTPYYNGKINPDCKYGTFSNGYQPDNVNGMKLTKTGHKTTFSTVTLSGEAKEVNQNIWKAKNGTYWLWDGANNKYQEMSERQVTLAAYGTFDNGYQPKGILGHGTLSKTGYTTKINGKTQNVWKTPDGKQWVWDGKRSKYVDTIRSMTFNPFH